MTSMAILIKNGSYNDFMTLSLIASGAIASDMEVKIFAMNDAVWALQRDRVGKDLQVKSNFPEFTDVLTQSMSEGKVTPWWDLLADLKELGDLTITVCALIADVAKLEENNFHDLVDDIAGVANFALDVDESDFVIAL